MKRFTAILFLTLFLVTNSGIAVNVHYCQGKITSVKLLFGEKHPCKCSKKPMKPGCCTSKTTLLKANEELAKVSHQAFQCPAADFILPDAAPLSLGAPIHCLHSFLLCYRPPPTKSGVPIYLLDRVFLI